MRVALVRRTAVAILIAAGLLAAFHPMLLSGFRQIQVDPGDSRLNHFLMEHSYRAIFGFPDSIQLSPAARNHFGFWNTLMFYPAPNTFAYTDTLLSVAPIYWTFRAAGFAEERGFQLWILAVAVLNFVIFHGFLTREFSMGPLGAAIGSYLFAFAASRINQLEHHQLLPQFFAVLALWGLLAWCRRIRAGESPGRIARAGGAVVVGLLAQCYSGVYYAWLFALALAVALPAALLCARGRGLLRTALVRYGVVNVAVSVAGLLLVWPLAAHYFAVVRATGMRDWWMVLAEVPRPWSWINMGPGSWLYGWLHGLDALRSLPFEHEHRIGFGWLTSLVAIVGLWRHREDERVRWLAGVALVLVLLAMSYGELTPWWLIYKFFPAGGAIRAVSRAALMLLIPAGLGVALFVGGPRRLRWAPIALAALGLGIAAEQLCTTESYDADRVRAEVNRLASQVADGACNVFFYSPLEGPTRSETYKHQLDAAWAALRSGVPTINGYSGNAPHGWSGLWPIDSREAEARRSLQLAFEEWIRSQQTGSVCWIVRSVEDSSLDP